MKYADTLKTAFSTADYPVFTFRDAELALKKKGIGGGYLRLMLHKYYASGIIKRVTKGVYTFHDDAIVAGFAFQPFYYGLESALGMLGVSLQGSNNVVMTTRNVRTGTRSFAGRNYSIMRIKPNVLFGFSTIKVGSFWVPVSDLEKTVIDMLYLNVPVREELYAGIAVRIDKKRFFEYSKVLGGSFKDLAMAKLDEIRHYI